MILFTTENTEFTEILEDFLCVLCELCGEFLWLAHGCRHSHSLKGIMRLSHAVYT